MGDLSTLLESKTRACLGNSGNLAMYFLRGNVASTDEQEEALTSLYAKLNFGAEYVPLIIGSVALRDANKLELRGYPEPLEIIQGVYRAPFEAKLFQKDGVWTSSERVFENVFQVLNRFGTSSIDNPYTTPLKERIQDIDPESFTALFSAQPRGENGLQRKDDMFHWIAEDLAPRYEAREKMLQAYQKNKPIPTKDQKYLF